MFGGKLLYCTLIDHSMQKPVYEGMIKVDGREAKVIFSFDGQARTAQTVGVAYADEDYSRIYDDRKNLPRKTLVDITYLYNIYFL